MYFIRVICYCSVCASFFLNALNANDQFSIPSTFCREPEWVTRYFNSVDEGTSVEEVVDFLFSLRLALIAKGYQPPALSDLYHSRK